MTAKMRHRAAAAQRISSNRTGAAIGMESDPRGPRVVALVAWCGCGRDTRSPSADSDIGRIGGGISVLNGEGCLLGGRQRPRERGETLFHAQT